MKTFSGSILLVLSALAAAEELRTPQPTMETKMASTDEVVQAKPKTFNVSERRDKRQLQGHFPIFYDGGNPPMQTLQPITVVTPVATNANAQSSSQPPAFLPNLPIIGTLVGNLPGLQNGQQNGGLLAGLPALITGLGGFGTLGGLNLGSFGQQAATPSNAINSCPLGQRLNCRCEPLLPLKPPNTRHQHELHIAKQNVRLNDDGSQEQRLQLSNGLIIYEHSGKKHLTSGQSDNHIRQGYYALRLHDGRYFNIFYTINDTDYTVKADLSTAPPTSVFDGMFNGLEHS